MRIMLFPITATAFLAATFITAAPLLNPRTPAKLNTASCSYLHATVGFDCKDYKQDEEMKELRKRANPPSPKPNEQSCVAEDRADGEITYKIDIGVNPDPGTRCTEVVDGMYKALPARQWTGSYTCVKGEQNTAADFHNTRLQFVIEMQGHGGIINSVLGGASGLQRILTTALSWCPDS
ncbi:hypothetical protein LTR86_003708 [Recurvomyces mirabilis]|nr:hypothetical protein LTR86_003708 [Recurvomyces mirabilis]